MASLGLNELRYIFYFKKNTINLYFNIQDILLYQIKNQMITFTVFLLLSHMIHYNCMGYVYVCHEIFIIYNFHSVKMTPFSMIWIDKTLRNTKLPQVHNYYKVVAMVALLWCHTLGWTGLSHNGFWRFLTLRPGHTALYGLITAKTRQKVISREADDVVRVDVEFKTSYSRFIDMAGRGGKSERRRTRQKVLNCSKC